MLSDVELITIPGLWSFKYNYFAGANASRFFKELKENRRIMGTRCPSCRRVLVPARGFCDACMEYTSEWQGVGPEGTLETFTIVATQFPGLPKPPLVMAYVTLDGADTALINLVHGMDLSDIDVAARKLNQLPRVTTRFVDQPQGRITDFSFQLL
jgi:uncharacterized OB-fold protein